MFLKRGFSRTAGAGLVFVLAVASAQSLAACEICAVYSAAQARGEGGTGFFVGAAEQFAHYGTLQLDGHETDNTADQSLDSSISQVLFGYNLTKRVGLQFNAPLLYRSFRRTEGAVLETGTEGGLGDVSLLGNLRLYRHRGTSWESSVHLLAGIKFPTGNTDRLREELMEVEPLPGEIPSGVHGHDLTLGSGSYDGIVGANVYARWKRVFFSGVFQYAIRSEGDYGYRFADDLVWSGGPGIVALLSDNYSIALQLNATVDSKGQDTFRGHHAEDTALTAVYVGPQVQVTWGEGLVAELGLDLPVLLDNSALQLVPDYRIRAALTWRF